MLPPDKGPYCQRMELYFRKQSLAKKAVENTEKIDIIRYGSEQHLAVLDEVW